MSDEFDRLAASLAEDVAGIPSAEGELAYVLLDVFTDTPLEGNQLAVFADGRGLDPARMQRLAREMNLSETVFVLPPEEGGDARIRIFTPLSELPFAGHPTLGTAFAVGTALGLAEVRLETGVGIVPGRAGARWRAGRLRADAAGDPGVGALRARGRAAGGARGRAVGPAGRGLRERPPPRLRRARERGGGGGAAPRHGGAGRDRPPIGANCFAGSGTRWKTRMFAPADGVPEDPATGSAAGPLAIHLCRHGRVPFGEEIVIRQGEEVGRPSVLHARAEGSAERVERVEVAGAALIVAGGRFVI